MTRGVCGAAGAVLVAGALIVVGPTAVANASTSITANPVICIVDSGGAICHQQTDQERQAEATGQLFDDIYCLATITIDPSCAIPWPGPGIYKVELDPGKRQIARVPSGDSTGNIG